VTELTERVGRLLGSYRAARGGCVVCRGEIRAGEERLHLRGGLEVHRRCATYRMRQTRTGVGRLGYPPR
jgi:hypothetical protein